MLQASKKKNRLSSCVSVAFSAAKEDDYVIIFPTKIHWEWKFYIMQKAPQKTEVGHTT